MHYGYKKKIVFLSGAGISAESGLKTFRDSDGLWENHSIMDVASIEGWNKNPKLVLDFYNARRNQLNNAFPNIAHQLIAKLEEEYEVEIITQNVDDLHERANSKKVLHLHGELRKMCSEHNKNIIFDWDEDIKIGDLADDNSQLRPYIVWFGEEVPKMREAIEICKSADIFVIIGTSLQVYPAASLIDYVPKNAIIYLIDKKIPNNLFYKNIKTIEKTASEGMKILFDELKNN